MPPATLLYDAFRDGVMGVGVEALWRRAEWILTGS